ncbi:MAG: hypothetical protein AB7I42_27820 [Bradyrhizobium sp.]|uniref:hypothetical protein n=1 Tax=Bradyrhizobium sp. TaxID=376 RepID=UPI003D0AEE7B
MSIEAINGDKHAEARTEAFDYIERIKSAGGLGNVPIFLEKASMAVDASRDFLQI